MVNGGVGPTNDEGHHHSVTSAALRRQETKKEGTYPTDRDKAGLECRIKRNVKYRGRSRSLANLSCSDSKAAFD
jgi:hypothetical protein